MQINKKSPIYFIVFFVSITFGIMFLITFAHQALSDKILREKNAKTISLVQKVLSCNPEIATLEKTEIYYCKNKSIIAQKVTSEKAYADKIEYLLFTNLDGLITHIDILSHKETPNLGAKIENKSWLQTLYNKPISLLKIKQDGGDIDSFTSASITPRVLLASASEKALWVKNNNKKIKELIQE